MQPDGDIWNRWRAYNADVTRTFDPAKCQRVNGQDVCTVVLKNGPPSASAGPVKMVENSLLDLVRRNTGAAVLGLLGLGALIGAAGAVLVRRRQ